jgi:hypothetical protein
MTENTVAGATDPLALAIYERIRPSLVEVSVPRKNGTEFRTLGVVAEKGGVTAWKGLLAGGAWDNPDDIKVHQDGRTWSAEMHTYSAECGLCCVRVEGEFSLPVLPWRRSNTLTMGEPLLYAVVGSDRAKPRLAWSELNDVFSLNDKHNRPFVWAADLDPAMPIEHTFAFDADGRVAGLLEPIRDFGPVATLLLGEWVGCLTEKFWVRGLLDAGAVDQLLGEYRRDPQSYGAEALCEIGRALELSGEKDEACWAFRRAIAKDPLNPWPHAALARLLGHDRAAEASWFETRAGQLRLQEQRQVEPLEKDGDEPEAAV